MLATANAARGETATCRPCAGNRWYPSAHCPLIVLTSRAWARATLWQAGDLDLYEAVDMLQAAVVRDGLVAKLGQDRVQEMMAAAFAAVRDDLLKFEDTEAEPPLAAVPPRRRLARRCSRLSQGSQGPRQRHVLHGGRARKAARTHGRQRHARTRVARNQPFGRPRGGKYGRGADARSARARRSCPGRARIPKATADMSTAQMRDVLARLMALGRSIPPSMTNCFSCWGSNYYTDVDAELERIRRERKAREAAMAATAMLCPLVSTFGTPETTPPPRRRVGGCSAIHSAAVPKLAHRGRWRRQDRRALCAGARARNRPQPDRRTRIPARRVLIISLEDMPTNCAAASWPPGCISISRPPTSTAGCFCPRRVQPAAS